MSLWVLGSLSLAIRWVWELLDPMDPSGFKLQLYFRDLVTLPLTAALWYGAVLRVKSRTTTPSIDSVLTKTADWLIGRPRLAIAMLSIALVCACAAISLFVFGTRATTFDEAVYLFQAKIFAMGRLWTDPPPVLHNAFSFPNTVITPDRWYGKFFAGQSMALLPGVLIGATFLINPLLSGALLLITVWAGRQLFDLRTGLLAGVMMLASPFVLLQGASYLSHVTTAIFFTTGTLWTLTSKPADRLKPLGAGLCIGAAFVCRPLSGFILALFAGGWSVLQATGKRWDIKDATRHIALTAAGAIPGLVFFFSYNWFVSANLFMFTADGRVLPRGFGLGLHTIKHTLTNLVALSVVLSGSPIWSLAALGAYLHHQTRMWLAPLAVLVSLYILAYGLHPVRSLAYGPRFYFELSPILLVLSARGVLAFPALLARRFHEPYTRLSGCVCRLYWVTVVVCLLGCLMPRFLVYHQRGHYYDIRSLVEANVNQPALVLIQSPPNPKMLFPYMSGFQDNDIDLAGPLLFARFEATPLQELRDAYPDRNAYVLDIDRHLIETLWDRRTAHGPEDGPKIRDESQLTAP